MRGRCGRAVALALTLLGPPRGRRGFGEPARGEERAERALTCREESVRDRTTRLIRRKLTEEAFCWRSCPCWCSCPASESAPAPASPFRASPSPKRRAVRGMSMSCSEWRNQEETWGKWKLRRGRWRFFDMFVCFSLTLFAGHRLYDRARQRRFDTRFGRCPGEKLEGGSA